MIVKRLQTSQEQSRVEVKELKDSVEKKEEEVLRLEQQLQLKEKKGEELVKRINAAIVKEGWCVYAWELKRKIFFF